MDGWMLKYCIFFFITKLFYLLLFIYYLTQLFTIHSPKYKESKLDCQNQDKITTKTWYIHSNLPTVCLKYTNIYPFEYLQTLRLQTQLWNLGFTDVYFFLKGHSKRCSNLSNVLSHQHPFPCYLILLVSSTFASYQLSRWYIKEIRGTRETSPEMSSPCQSREFSLCVRLMATS